MPQTVFVFVSHFACPLVCMEQLGGEACVLPCVSFVGTPIELVFGYRETEDGDVEERIRMSVHIVNSFLVLGGLSVSISGVCNVSCVFSLCASCVPIRRMQCNLSRCQGPHDNRLQLQCRQRNVSQDRQHDSQLRCCWDHVELQKRNRF